MHSQLPQTNPSHDLGGSVKTHWPQGRQERCGLSNLLAGVTVVSLEKQVISTVYNVIFCNAGV